MESSTVLAPLYGDQSLAMTSGGRGVSRYHASAAALVSSPEDLEKARNNKPFGSFEEVAPRIKEALSNDPKGTQAFIDTHMEEFLRQHYPHLEESHVGFEIDFSITGGTDDEQEAKRFDELTAANVRIGLSNQANQVLKPAYANFQTLRSQLRHLRGLDLLSASTMLPDSCLPTFLVTAPVWYVAGRGKPLTNTTGTNGAPDKFSMHMAERLGTLRLADWYQVWNRRSRPFTAYQGDVIPPHLLQTIERLQGELDYLVIATPFHDVAAREWQAPAPKRMIDPYLLGFSEALPECFFFLGRWSNTGVFPLASEMMAQGMNCLREQLPRVKAAFRDSVTWAAPKSVDLKGWGTRDGKHIQAAVEGAIKAFDELNLVPWLSEGRPQRRLLNPVG
ncbi:MAG TPA: hypothetical protein VLA04_01885 [Verrucomicrobiae bacterium]|nr:hypothetical protein [Verrucomicrobiae bacterium]